MTDDEQQLAFLRALRRMDRAVMPLLDWCMNGGATDDELRAHIAGCRRDTGDMVTDLVAVYCAVVMVGAIGVRPTRRSMHGFTVHTVDGQQVDAEAVPPGSLTRMRMIVAIANSEPLAARDLFVVYRRTHTDEQVTDFIADFVTEVSHEATCRGMTVKGRT